MTIQFTDDYTATDTKGRERTFRKGEIIKAHHYPRLNLPRIVIAGKAKDISPDQKPKADGSISKATASSKTSDADSKPAKAK